MAKVKEPLLELGRRKFGDFDVLHDAVCTTLHGIPNISVLAVYDTALRLAAFRGILPNNVYLHAGTKAGALNLGLKSKSETLAMSELPPVLRKLSAYEVEDCLCIYKDAFKPV